MTPPPPFGTFPKIHPIWRSHPSLKALNIQNDKSFSLKYVRENLLQSICTKLCNLNEVTDMCQFYTLWSFPTSSKSSSKASLTFTSFSCLSFSWRSSFSPLLSCWSTFFGTKSERRPAAKLQEARTATSHVNRFASKMYGLFLSVKVKTLQITLFKIVP